MDVRKIKIEDFDYPLPEERIALHPLAQRDSCKLLAANRNGKISHHVFSDLPLLIKPDTLIVANETKVIRARMEFEKETGAKIEIFLLEPLRPHDYAVSFASREGCSWTCLIGNKKRWKEGSLTKKLEIAGTALVLQAKLGPETPGNGYEVTFSWDNPEVSFAEVVEGAGNIPIPPYLNRESEESDTSDYQTVYSRTDGSVAAPTAGLHFTPGLISELKQRGDEFATVTLHVGAGTFQPVKSEEIGDHPMHSEWISVSRGTLSRLIRALENGRDILAIGTTSVRTLESLPYLGLMIAAEGKAGPVTQWMPYDDRYREIDTIRVLKILRKYLDENGLNAIEARTSILIAPGFRWRIVNKLITNFHQPKSTLLLLVSSFIDGDKPREEKIWKQIYTEALDKSYRFLSYGDACLFTRGPRSVELPAAKSMVIRAATICAATDPRKLDELANLGLCDDSEFYISALKKVLQSRETTEDTPVRINIGEGAAPLRFLTAFAASLPGANIDVTCSEGLRKRPIKPLIDTLKALGADVDFNDSIADWRLTIQGRQLKGGEIEVDSSFTSQYVSALLLASLLWDDGIRLKEASDKVVSRPYIKMTREMLANRIILPEPDWSAAAFFYEYALISGRDVGIAVLIPPEISLQGDSAVCGLYSLLGVETEFASDGSANLLFKGISRKDEFEFDFTDFPDMVPSVAVALCYRRIPFRFRGVAHLRYKECDRLTALQSLLVRIGYEVEVENDTLVFNGEFRPYQEFPVEIDPYGDHRMAMAFYPLELAGMVTIDEKQVVSKSFPNFYQQF